MKELQVQLREQAASKLKEAADRLNVSPKQLSMASVEERLVQPEDEFGHSADYAIQKNSDLYRRLA